MRFCNYIIIILLIGLIHTSLAFSQTQEQMDEYESFFQSFSRNRDMANQFLIDFGDQVALYNLLYDDIVIKKERNSKKILILCALAIEGQGDGQSQAFSLIESIYKNPIILEPRRNTIDEFIYVKQTLNSVIHTFCEINDERSFDNLKLGMNRDYWLHDALSEIEWFGIRAINSLVSLSIEAIYYLQPKYDEAKTIIDNIRSSNPSNEAEEHLKERVEFHDTGIIYPDSYDNFFAVPYGILKDYTSSVSSWSLY